MDKKGKIWFHFQEVEKWRISVMNIAKLQKLSHLRQGIKAEIRIRYLDSHQRDMIKVLVNILKILKSNQRIEKIHSLNNQIKNS